MSNRALFIIALVAVAACALVYFEKDRPGTVAARERERSLLEMKADQIDRLELTNPSGAFTFVRTADGGWEMESPVAYPADLSSVGNLLSDLEFAQRQGLIRREGDPDFDTLLPQFGLVEPRIRARLFQGKSVRTLSVGSATARPGLFYALVEQGRTREIVLIDSMLEGQFLEGPDYWRSRDLIDFSPPTVTGVIARREGREEEMKKKEESWQVVRPLDLTADPIRVTRYLGDIRNLRAQSFAAEAGGDVSTYGFSPPSGSLELVFPDGSRTITFGGKVPDDPSLTYAQPAGRGNVVTVSTDAVRGLLDLLGKVRPRNVFEWPIHLTPSSFEVSVGDQTFRLVRQEGPATSWEVTQGEWASPADPSKVESFINNLRAMEALDFLDTKENPNPAYGLARPALVLTIRLPAASNLPEEQTLRFGATRQGETFLESSQVPFIVTVAQNFLESFPKRPWDLLGDEVRVADSAAIQRVVWQGGGPTLTVEKNDEGTWSASGMKEPLDEMYLVQQTEMLGNLVIGEWLGPPASRDFARPQLTLTVVAGEVEKKIFFGNRRPDGTVPVRIEGEPFAFTLPEDTFKALALRPVTQAPARR
ncbi:MAG: DUF4340 domain-containing protein [Verrucomicrobiia bacterium]